MPFGPAMQGYVASMFGTLRNRNGEEMVSPCMDDILISSRDLKSHIEDCQDVNKKASAEGFEFKFKKGQYNQDSVEFWGCIRDANGRRPQPRKVEQ